MNPLSIVITTNGRAELQKTLAALSQQVIGSDELVLVVDGSSLTGQYFPCGTQVVSINHKGYRIGTMRNLGIIAAQHERIVQLDDDCVPDRGFLDAYRTSLKHFEICCGRIDRESRGVRMDDYRLKFAGGAENALLKEGGGGNMGYLKSDVIRLGLYDQAYDFGYGWEETDLLNRACRERFAIRFLDDACVVHQNHAKRGGHYENLERNRAMFEDRWRCNE